jgi:hypothetical protein
MNGNEAVKGLLFGAIPGAILYVIGSLIGPALGPGWEDLLHGIAGFVMIFGALLNMRRRVRRTAKQ